MTSLSRCQTARPANNVGGQGALNVPFEGYALLHGARFGRPGHFPVYLDCGIYVNHGTMVPWMAYAHCRTTQT
jgi:hypothetical protein